MLFAPRFTPADVEGRHLPPDCPPQRIDERVKVSYVYDGDTVKLSDGRRVRFIGINTPEMGHHETLTQPYAEAARASLQAALKTGGNLLSLQYGKEHKDHYGRLLAHAYAGDDENVAVLLLRRGHATTLVVPPNTLAANCYRQIEHEARTAGRGLWQLAAYHAQAADTLRTDSRGFHIVRGRVARIVRTKHQVRLVLDGVLVARISEKDLVNFEPDYLENLVDQTVELRGWIKPEGAGIGIRIRHPMALAPVGESHQH
ncbi:MAG TPA: thermonuclease family protein [Gammaproteobacteria bacterium]|nr:thermonuclease family protein [Gammaproteobacteria bacterium]